MLWSCPLLQLLAIMIESCRLVLIQILLQGFGMDPLVVSRCSCLRPMCVLLGESFPLIVLHSIPQSLYYFAPVCLATNTVALFAIEG